MRSARFLSRLSDSNLAFSDSSSRIYSLEILSSSSLLALASSTANSEAILFWSSWANSMLFTSCSLYWGRLMRISSKKVLRFRSSCLYVTSMKTYVPNGVCSEGGVGLLSTLPFHMRLSG